jgi:Phage integrase, N-terminal SAM-like domain
MAEKHTILGGKVHVYQRENSSVWQCSSYLEGRNRRVSTKKESLAKAKEFAEDWYLELRGKKARGELLSELTFAQAAERFTKEYELMTAGERNEIYVNGHQARLKNRLLPYFGKMGLSQITSGVVQDSPTKTAC